MRQKDLLKTGGLWVLLIYLVFVGLELSFGG